MKNGIYIENNRIMHYLNDELHNENGPAIENWLGDIYSLDNKVRADNQKKWFVFGQELSEKDFNEWKIKNELNKKLNIILKEKKKIKRHKI